MKKKINSKYRIQENMKCIKKDQYLYISEARRGEAGRG